MRARSWLVIASLLIGLAVARAAPSVAVDLSRLEGTALPNPAELEQALVIRLVQEGFAIDPTAQPAIVVAITGDDRQVVLSAKSAFFERERTIDVNGASGAQLELEVVQRVVELARLAREAAPPPSPERVTATAPADRGLIRQPRIQLGLDVGVAASSIEGALHARYAITRAIGVAIRASASTPDARDVSVGEQELVAGPSFEWPLARTLAVDASLLAGVRRHHFELAMPALEPSGTRYDAALTLPLRLALRPWRAFEVSVWGIAKLSREREHVSGSTVLWQRDLLSAGAGAGVAARF